MSRRAAHSLLAALAGCSVGLSYEDEVMRTLADAYAGGDCATVLELGPTFTSARPARTEEVLYYRGRCLQKSGRETEAIELLTPLARAEVPAARAADSLYYLGRALYSLARHAEAAEVFAEVQARFPDSHPDGALYYEGLSAYQLGSWDAAASRFDRLIAEQPDSIYLDNAYYYRILVALRQDDCVGARALLDRMKQAVPASAYVPRAEQKLTDGGCPL